MTGTKEMQALVTLRETDVRAIDANDLISVRRLAARGESAPMAKTSLSAQMQGAAKKRS